MKKFFMIAVMAVAAITANAQQEVGSITVTPKAGINVSTFTGSDAEGVKSKVGFVGGADFTYQIDESIALSAGLFYSQMGTGYKNTDTKMKLDYLSIPVVASYYVYNGLAIKAGLQPSINVSAKLGDTDIKDGIESFDLAIPVGVSYEYKNVVVDARYNLGLLKPGKEVGTFKAGNVQNSGFQFTLGYKF